MLEVHFHEWLFVVILLFVYLFDCMAVGWSAQQGFFLLGVVLLSSYVKPLPVWDSIIIRELVLDSQRFTIFPSSLSVCGPSVPLTCDWMV